MPTYGHVAKLSYHFFIQFEDITLSMESLYCILNGDDLYTTFEEAHSSTQSVSVKIFSEVYLALFIFIFIYIVLSIIVGIFDHAYDSLSDDSLSVSSRFAIHYVKFNFHA